MRVHDQYVRVGEIRTRYWAAGNGPEPLLLLHGIGRSVEDWADTLPALAARYRVYALDLVGFGLTDKPAADYSFAFNAERVHDFLDTLGIDRVTIIGSSLGGGVALECAARRPERVAGLVLVGSAGFGSDVSIGLRLATLPILGEWLTQPSRANARQTLRALFHDAALITPERVEQEYRRSALPGAQTAFLRVARALMTPWGGKRTWIDSLQARLRHFAAPILLLWGACDQIVPVHHCTTALTYFTHASGHIIGSCGHFPQLERPREFAEIVLRFLAQNKRAC